MSHIIPKHLIRRGLALLGTVAAVGCSSGDGGTEPGAIALAIVPTSASVVQGGSGAFAATLTRSGGFTGTVNLTVTGAPTGVTGVVSNVQTVGLVTTATITINVDAATAPGPYSLVVHGTGTGVTEATAAFALTVTEAPAFTMTLGTGGVEIEQGRTGGITVTLVRTNFAGGVTLTLEGAPAGVTWAFDPTPATANSSQLTLTVGAAVVPGDYTLVVRGTATGLADRTASFPLGVTFPPPFTLSLTAAALTIPQGASAPTTTVNITRVNFTDAVTLSVFQLGPVHGLPPGVTAAFVPPAPTGNSSVLTLTVGAAVTPGVYDLFVSGTASGFDEGTPLTLTVTAPTGSGNVTVSFATCAAADKAAWVAFQDGSGAWVPVTGVNDLYQFNITQSKGGVAYVVLATGASTINVFYYSQAELTAATLNFCGAAPTGKTVAATVANLPAGTQGRISFGGGFGFALADITVELTNVLDGLQDLVAYDGPLAAPTAADRVILARGLNPADGGSLGTVDFTSAASFTPTGALITLMGGVGGETYSQAMSYLTGPACVRSVLYPTGTFGAFSFTAYGIGATNQVSTDFHNLSVTAIDGGLQSFRLVTESFHTIAARTLTLPSVLGTITASDAGGPYKRLMLVTTLPADLNSSAVSTYTDLSGKSGVIIATAAWLGGLNVSLTLPDFSALAGWSNAWAPATGVSLDWTLTGSATSLTALCQEGARVASSTKTGTL